ncbi:hypothetical protein D3C72_584390 [compost metagenome]
MFWVTAELSPSLTSAGSSFTASLDLPKISTLPKRSSRDTHPDATATARQAARQAFNGVANNGGMTGSGGGRAMGIAIITPAPIRKHATGRLRDVNRGIKLLLACYRKESLWD